MFSLYTDNLTRAILKTPRIFPALRSVLEWERTFFLLSGRTPHPLSYSDTKEDLVPPAKKTKAPSGDPANYGGQAIEDNTLEGWPNPETHQSYRIHLSYPEFTCLCPRSGYPDFATIEINYIPDRTIVELRSLKLYLNGFRDRRISHEAVVNQIFRDLVELLSPREMDVTADFNVRGNLKTVIRVDTEMNRKKKKK